MQQSSLEFFCDECGAANPEDATVCIACQHPLTRPPVATTEPIQPITVAPQPILQVVAGAATPTMSAPLSDELAPGTLLQNHYKIIGEIGRGGYSIVYHARDTKNHGRQVAIKQINLRNLTSRQIIEATETFNRETTLLPRLTFPGIPSCYGHFTDPEHWYLVMQYIKGQTLEEYLQRSAAGDSGYFSVKETLFIGIKLCDILDYLHSRQHPWIFRDIKPANILLTPNKKVYLIDFGIARTFNPNKTKDTTPLGSPGFAAPEQYGKGQSDPRTDIYGLGATLQTLLTGRDPLELRAGELSRSPQPIPPYLQQLLTSMLNPDQELRPGKIALVKKGLQKMQTQIYRMSHLFWGFVLGSTLWVWLSLILFFVPQADYYYYYTPFESFTCLWFLAALALFITMIVCAIRPTRRFLALGILIGLVMGLLGLFGIMVLIRAIGPITI